MVTAADISSIVGHTCGVERAGKAYKQVLTSLRKAMEEKRAMKAVYVYSNYNLNEHKQSAGDSFSAFKAPDAAGEQAARQLQSRIPTLGIRCGEAISSSKMSPKMAPTKTRVTRVTRRKPRVLERLARRERRELHAAVGSERYADQSRTASPSRQSLRHSMAAWSTVLSTCAGRRTAGRWARSQGWSRAPRPVSSRNSTTASCGPTAARDRPSCKSTTMAMGHTLAIILGSS